MLADAAATELMIWVALVSLWRRWSHPDQGIAWLKPMVAIPGKIDRKSLRQDKANLAILNGRYGEVERRFLEWCANTKSEE